MRSLGCALLCAEGEMVGDSSRVRAGTGWGQPEPGRCGRVTVCGAGGSPCALPPGAVEARAV